MIMEVQIKHVLSREAFKSTKIVASVNANYY